MSRGTTDLEERTMRILAEAAKGPLPDAGIAALLTKVVRDAYRRGGEDSAVEIADAYVLYILDDDDMDGFRDALTERLPRGWKSRIRVRRPGHN